MQGSFPASGSTVMTTFPFACDVKPCLSVLSEHRIPKCLLKNGKRMNSVNSTMLPSIGFAVLPVRIKFVSHRRKRSVERMVCKTKLTVLLSVQKS